MIEITIEGLSQLQDKLANFPDTLLNNLSVASQALADQLVQNIRNDKLSGQVLTDKTGLLKESIESLVQSSGSDISADVFVADDVPYAAIQEYGGQTKAHIIEAAKGKVLAFGWQGKQAFFAYVNHPGSHITEHSYLRSAFEEMQDAITGGMADALSDTINR